MKRRIGWVAGAALALVVAGTGVAFAQVSDVIGADGLKRRGDGTIDDSQRGDRGRGTDDVGPDGLKRRGDGSIDDSQPGARGDDRSNGRRRGRGRKRRRKTGRRSAP